MNSADRIAYLEAALYSAGVREKKMREALEKIRCTCISSPKGICPQCHGELKRVYNTSGYLNDDQFDSVRAGDWYCERCRGTEARSGFKYWWNRDLEQVSTTCLRCAALAPLSPDEITAYQRVIDGEVERRTRECIEFVLDFGSGPGGSTGASIMTAEAMRAKFSEPSNTGQEEP